MILIELLLLSCLQLFCRCRWWKQCATSHPLKTDRVCVCVGGVKEEEEDGSVFCTDVVPRAGGFKFRSDSWTLVSRRSSLFCFSPSFSRFVFHFKMFFTPHRIFSATFEDKEALDLYIRDVNKKYGENVSQIVMFFVWFHQMSKVRGEREEMRRRARDADRGESRWRDATGTVCRSSSSAYHQLNPKNQLHSIKDDELRPIVSHRK